MPEGTVVVRALEMSGVVIVHDRNSVAGGGSGGDDSCAANALTRIREERARATSQGPSANTSRADRGHAREVKDARQSAPSATATRGLQTVIGRRYSDVQRLGH